MNHLKAIEFLRTLSEMVKQQHLITIHSITSYQNDHRAIQTKNFVQITNMKNSFLTNEYEALNDAVVEAANIICQERRT